MQLRGDEPLRMLDCVQVNGTIYSVTERSFTTKWIYTLIAEENGQRLIIRDVSAKKDWQIVSVFNGPYCECISLKRYGLEPIRKEGCEHIKDYVEKKPNF